MFRIEFFIASRSACLVPSAWNFTPSTSIISLGDESIAVANNFKVETEYSTNEGKRIDILIYSDTFVCLVENKYGSDEHDEQCKHYKNFIQNKSKFKNHKHKYFIFLDINKTEECQFDIEGPLHGYSQLTYRDIHDILLNMINETKFNSIEEKIIEQYINVIKEKYLMFDQETISLCREIYKDHKTVIDLISQVNMVTNADIMSSLRSWVEKNSAIMNKNGITRIDFLPIGINDLERLKYGQDSKWLQGHIAGFQIEKTKVSIDLSINIQESLEENQKTRKYLMSYLEMEYNKTFKGRENYWSWLPLESIEFDELYEFNSVEEVKKHIEQKLTKHLEKFLNVLNVYVKDAE